jgi:hypothetical protein
MTSPLLRHSEPAGPPHWSHFSPTHAPRHSQAGGCIVSFVLMETQRSVKKQFGFIMQDVYVVSALHSGVSSQVKLQRGHILSLSR